jgi:lactate dehydrogenase-like 2-hydroxyacid dehydrogenase
VGLILAITRRLAEGERLVRRGEWKGWAFDLMLGSELRGKAARVDRFGRIGRAVACASSRIRDARGVTARGGDVARRNG